MTSIRQPPACLSFIPSSEPECDINTISDSTTDTAARRFMSSSDRRVSPGTMRGFEWCVNKDRSPATIVIIHSALVGTGGD